MGNKLYEWQPTSTCLRGRPKMKWENEYLKIMAINNLTKLIQDGVKWKEVVEARTFKH
jgi:hypothetical protein